MSLLLAHAESMYKNKRHGQYIRSYIKLERPNRPAIALALIDCAMCLHVAFTVTATIAITLLYLECVGSKRDWTEKWMWKIQIHENYSLLHCAATWCAPDTQTNVGCNLQWREVGSLTTYTDTQTHILSTGIRRQRKVEPITIAYSANARYVELRSYILLNICACDGAVTDASLTSLIRKQR